MNLGEASGVAVNSSGHVFVFSRSNSANGPAFGAAAAQHQEGGHDARQHEAADRGGDQHLDEGEAGTPALG